MSHSCSSCNGLVGVSTASLSNMVELNLANTPTSNFNEFEATILLNLAKQHDSSHVVVDISGNLNNGNVTQPESQVGTNIVTHNLEFDNTTSFAIVSNRIENEFIPVDASYSSVLGSNDNGPVSVTSQYVIEDSYYGSAYTFTYSRNVGPFEDSSKNWSILFDESSSNVDLALAQNSQLHDDANCLVNCQLDASNNPQYFAGNSLSHYFERDLNNNQLLPESIIESLASNNLDVSLNADVEHSNVGMYKVEILDASYSSSFSDNSLVKDSWMGFGPVGKDASYITITTILKKTSSRFKNMVDTDYKSVVSKFLTNTNGNLSVLLRNEGGGKISSPDEDIFTCDDRNLIANDSFMSKLYPTLKNQMSFTRGSVSTSCPDASVNDSLGEKLNNVYHTANGLIHLQVAATNARVTTTLPNSNYLTIESSIVSYNDTDRQGLNSMNNLSLANMEASDVSYNIICKLKNTLNVTSRSSEIVFDNNDLRGSITDNLSTEFASNVATQINLSRSLTYHTTPHVGIITQTDDDNYSSLNYSNYDTNDLDFMQGVVALTKIFDIKDNNDNFQHVAVKLDNKTLEDLNIVFESDNS